jgi:hypothetical protein
MTSIEEITWCGLRIYMRSLNVAMDCSRFEQGSESSFPFLLKKAYKPADLVDSLTVEKGRAPGLSFKHKVLRSVWSSFNLHHLIFSRMARTRSHILFTDSSLNSSFTVHLNIYENFLITAMKVVQYVMEWGVDVNKAQALLRGA